MWSQPTSLRMTMRHRGHAWQASAAQFSKLPAESASSPCVNTSTPSEACVEAVPACSCPSIATSLSLASVALASLRRMLRSWDPYSADRKARYLSNSARLSDLAAHALPSEVVVSWEPEPRPAALRGSMNVPKNNLIMSLSSSMCEQRSPGQRILQTPSASLERTYSRMQQRQNVCPQLSRSQLSLWTLA